MIINQTPYPISFEREMSQAITCRYGEEMRQYIFKPDINVSGLSCLLQIAKPDGTFTENGVEVHTDPDTGDCTLVITIPKQATVFKGLAKYSICCYGEVETETHLLYSAEGPLWVDDDLITEEMIESVAEVNGYTFPQDFVTIDMLSEIIPEALPAEYGFYLRAAQDNGVPEWAPIDIPFPGYGPLDAGKVLTVNADGTDVEWEQIDKPFPEYGASDAGKVLTVNADGTDVEWENAGGSHTYSTSEQVIGVYIDGRTVYEKTFSGTVAGNGNRDIYHGISNLDLCLSVVGSVKMSGMNFMFGSGTDASYLGLGVGYITDSVMNFYSGTRWNGYNINYIITLRYVKTS